MENKIILSEVSSSLGTRSLGDKYKNEILRLLKSNEIVYVDFKGVDVVTNSFANECFGKLKDILTKDVLLKRISVLNANDFIKRVIVSAL